MNNPTVVAAVFVALLASAGTVRAQVQEPAGETADHRIPAVAGVLSAIVPGVGSFYAGNSGHGVRHLVIMVGADVITVVGLAKFAALGSETGSGLTWFFVGLSAYAVNDVWSIVTAVGDANAHNREADRRSGRVVGTLYFDPQLRILGTSARNATHTSFGLELGRVAF